MRDSTRASVLFTTFAALIIGTSGVVHAAAAPQVFSVIEGRDTGTDRPVLVLIGKSLTKFTELRLEDPRAVRPPEVLPTLLRGKTMLVLGVAADTPGGWYDLVGTFGAGETQAFRVCVTNEAPLPGAVSETALDPALRADLDDAASLGGNGPSYYRDAGNLDAGTLSTDRYSAYGDLVAEAKVGTEATQVAAGNHDHDAAYPRRTDLSDAGTVNDSRNPVDWTRLKGVPVDLADGRDSDTLYAAGDGLSLVATTFSVQFAGTGSATTAARSDHDHDARYYAKAELNAAGGTLNQAGNPVDWTRLKGVPEGFADGTDADTTYAAGTGLALAGTTFSVTFAGTGTAATSARSDHDHDARYYTQPQLNAADGTLNAATNPLDWSRLKSVPAGFADGTDDDTTYDAGRGLSLTGTTFSVSEVDWDQLTGVPAGFADGTDDNAWTEASGDAYRSSGRVGIGTSTPSASLHVSGVDGALFAGTYGSGSIPATGAGTRMMWYPGKAAFRAGNVTGTQWDDSSIGTYSTATGYTTTASGAYSTATGYGATARGSVSTATGSNTLASGGYSTAMGASTTASGDFSTAMGYGPTASGYASTAMGFNSIASGAYSVAMGVSTWASGDHSMAVGSYNTAQAYGSLVAGRFNTVSGSTTGWVSTDPLLVVGNGASSGSRSDAFNLLKNGNLTIAGSLTQNSDERLKKDIAPLTGVLAKLEGIRGVSYRFKDEERAPAGRQIGLLAQEVREAFPELVREDPNGTLSLSYGNLAAVLVEAVKEQQAVLEGQRKELEDLKARLARLEGGAGK